VTLVISVFQARLLVTQPASTVRHSFPEISVSTQTIVITANAYPVNFVHPAPLFQKNAHLDSTRPILLNPVHSVKEAPIALQELRSQKLRERVIIHQLVQASKLLVPSVITE